MIRGPDPSPSPTPQDDKKQCSSALISVNLWFKKNEKIYGISPTPFLGAGIIVINRILQKNVYLSEVSILLQMLKCIMESRV